MRMWRILLGALVLPTLGGGCRRSQPIPPPAPPPPPSAGVPVTLYFLRPGLVQGDDLLQGEVRLLPDAKPETVLQALLEGPQSPALLPLLPLGVKVRSVKQEGGRMTVDFSREFKGFAGGSNFAYLAVYSVVNTLTELSGVREVQILVEGEAVPDFAGVLDLREPLSRDESLLAKP